MPHVVYALFEDAEVADLARADLSRGAPHGPGHDVQPHERRLDPDRLPDAATSYGRQLVMSTTLGSAVFMIAGAILGAYDVVPGMNVDMGVLLGLISGTVIGVYTGMQAGTRVAKAPLLELAPRLGQGAVLLTIEVSRRELADQLVDELDERGARPSGIC